MIQKEMFKGYLYGYLNEFYLYKALLAKNGLSFKEFKIKRISNYLKIPKKFIKLFLYFILIVSKLEIIVSLLLLLYRLLKYSILYILTPKVDIKKSNLILGLNTDKDVFVKMIKSVGIDKKNITIIKIPSTTNKYEGFKKISLLSGVEFIDIIKSFIYSIKIIFLLKRKYGKRDFLFRAYSSFEYFITCFFVKGSDVTNKYYFTSLIDRWLYLFGGIEHTTCFIQHGLVDANIKLRKIDKVDYAYYINKKQKEICEKTLFKNVPIPYYQKSMSFSSSDKLLKNGLRNVLLICNMIFFDKEKEIIRDLNKEKVNLYVKPHPSNSYEPYNNLLLNNKFTLLEKGDLPKVDIVISYNSTLATEYENKDVLVLKHSKESFMSDFIKIFKENNRKVI